LFAEQAVAVPDEMGGAEAAGFADSSAKGVVGVAVIAGLVGRQQVVGWIEGEGFAQSGLLGVGQASQWVVAIVGVGVRLSSKWVPFRVFLLVPL